MAIDYSQSAIPKGPSRFAQKQQKRAEEARQMRICYDQVDKRDGFRCRVCRKACSPSAVGMLERAHHHHLTYRSQGGEHLSRNVCLLCPSCHDALHTKCTLRLEGDADQRDPLTKKLNGIAVYVPAENAHGWQISRWV